MNIYTKTGDKGTTSLANGQRVSKTDCRLEAYGTSDELNSFVGNLRAAISCQERRQEDNNQQGQGNFYKQADQLLYYIQNRLFDIGATLAGAPTPLPDDAISLLEHAIDDMQNTLTPLRAFILPAGSETVTRCHICRTVTRRLERNCLRINPTDAIQNELIFLNRLSDYFFVLARKLGEIEHIEVSIWQK